MAKETIFASTPAEKWDDGEPVDRRVPQVIWTRDLDVQLGIVSDVSPDSHNPDGSLFTESLDRVQINRLIATLRRARDAAYGADE